MFTVKIWIITDRINGRDMEEIDIASNKSLRAAKNKATRWINKYYFESDVLNLSKEKFETRTRANWNLYIKDEWQTKE